VLFSVLIGRIFLLQIIKGEKYAEQSSFHTEKEREIKSTRGNIYDCNGKLLASNELSYSITLEDTGTLKTNEEKNEMIHKLIQTIEKNDTGIDTEFSVKLNKKKQLVFAVDGLSELRFKKDVYYLKNVTELSEEQKNATAEEVFKYLKQDESKCFGISDSYSTEDALKIMGIRFAMLMNSYARYLPITIATSVNEKTVARK